jgi:hypothetical protein
VNLGRIGHYFTPNGPSENPNVNPTGSCRTSIVTSHDGYPDDKVKQGCVTVVAFSHGGSSFQRHEDIPVTNTGDVLPGDEDSFHLNADCPWRR